MDVFTGVNRHYELKYFVIVKKVFFFNWSKINFSYVIVNNIILKQQVAIKINLAQVNYSIVDMIKWIYSMGKCN